MDWPIYFKDQLIVGDPNNAVGVCSLWTLKEMAVKDLNKSDFAVCGQLYSKEGIKYIVRNILANPRISYLILCGQDRSNSGQALLEAFQTANFNDSTIPPEALAELRQNVKIIDIRGDLNDNQLKKTLASLEPKSSAWAQPRVFNLGNVDSVSSFPTDPSGFILKYPTVADGWPWVLKHIMRFGITKQTDYGVREKEIINLMAVITAEDPQKIKFVNYFNFSPQEFADYVPQILTADIGNKYGEISYTYGERLRNFAGIDQIQEGIINKLKKSINSRRALACTWRVEKDINSQQPPCLNLVQAVVQNNLLHLTAYFRSNDMFGAWPQNTLAIRRMQDLICQGVGVELGNLITISCSAHIYEQDFARAEKIIQEHANQLRCGWDGRGNLAITLDRTNREIVATHYSPQGLKINEYRGPTAETLYLRLDKDLAVSQIGHAFYLGKELAKAEIALNQNLEYHQA